MYQMFKKLQFRISDYYFYFHFAWISYRTFIYSSVNFFQVISKRFCLCFMYQHCVQYFFHRIHYSFLNMEIGKCSFSVIYLCFIDNPYRKEFCSILLDVINLVDQCNISAFNFLLTSVYQMILVLYSTASILISSSTPRLCHK